MPGGENGTLNFETKPHVEVVFQLLNWRGRKEKEADTNFLEVEDGGRTTDDDCSSIFGLLCSTFHLSFNVGGRETFLRDQNDA